MMISETGIYFFSRNSQFLFRIFFAYFKLKNFLIETQKNAIFYENLYLSQRFSKQS